MSDQGAAPAGRNSPTLLEHYGSGIVGGIIGGLWMMALVIIYGLVSGNGVWFPLNLIGATAMRGMQYAPPETLMAFDPKLASAGLIMHFLYSMCVGFLFAIFLRIFPRVLPRHPLIWAIVIGLLLWALAFLALPRLNPRMWESIDPLLFGIAHIFYGLILGLWIVRDHPQLTAGQEPAGAQEPEGVQHPATFAPRLGTGIIPSGDRDR